ncbi:homoserine O-acetyltransferase [Verrucomicrobiales bacterium]|nr:homoserine O-acetyltransferase [Verrucomicrobiales bacterium]
MPGLNKKTALFTTDAPLPLACGASLPGFTLAYETYGEMTPERDNVILLFHALTGSQNAAGETLSTGVPEADSRWTSECTTGWWDAFVGPGLAVDTDQFFVVCANYIGGCYGSTGPSSPHPEDGQPYGSRFPRIAMRDIVESQVRLLDHLEVEKTHAVIGNSIGGMLALEFATRHAARTHLVVPVATSMSSGALHRLMNFEQILAIESDPNFSGGDYYGKDQQPPDSGLALARMISHKTFIHVDMLERRARDEVSGGNGALSWYPLSRSLESYMLHQGQKFTSRFDANTYLRVIDAWQQFDLLAGRTTAEVFAPSAHQSYLIFSIDSDVCFYPDDQGEITQALEANGIPAMHHTVHSEKGHDSFLLEPELYAPQISYFLSGKTG